MTKGLDISVYQGNPDFAKVKDAGYEFIIMRAGYGKVASQKDKVFEQNYRAAKAAGLHVGVYWYSYAMTPEEAKQEAQACLQAIAGKQFDFPVYYDVEEQKQFALGKSKVSAIIKAFLEVVEAAGYWVGLYGSYSSLTTYTDEDIRSRYAIWLAHWGVSKSPYTGAYGVWQRSATQNVPGINGNVDYDESFVDYPSQIKAAGLNGYPKQEVPTETTKTLEIILGGKSIYKGEV